MSNQLVKQRKWLYPVLYAAFFIISMLPLYTEKPYAPQETQDVIINLLMVVTTPYKAYAPIFHVLTLLMITLIAWQPAKMGRVWAGYMGLNYLMIALVQTMGTTAQYGFVLHTGGMVMYGVLGLVWLVVAFRNELQTSFRSISWQHLLITASCALSVLGAICCLWYWGAAGFQSTLASGFAGLRVDFLFHHTNLSVLVDSVLSAGQYAGISNNSV